MVSADHDKEREILLDMEVKLRSGDALVRFSVQIIFLNNFCILDLMFGKQIIIITINSIINQIMPQITVFWCCYRHCWGSGSGSVWSGPPGSAFGPFSHKYGSGCGSFHHQAKTVRKTLISSVLQLLYDFLSVFRIWVRRIRMFFWASRIRIRFHSSEIRIRGSGSVPEFHGSPTLATKMKPNRNSTYSTVYSI